MKLVVDPATREQYEERFYSNVYAYGRGTETGQSFPCPFCGSKDFMLATLLNLQEDTSKEHTCTACGRSGRMVYQRVPGADLQGGTVKVVFVMTGGPSIEHMPWLHEFVTQLVSPGPGTATTRTMRTTTKIEPPPYRDLFALTEDQRIQAIGDEAMKGKLVGFMVDDESDKADRYMRKLRERFPRLQEVDRHTGPVKGVITLRVRLMES